MNQKDVLKKLQKEFVSIAGKGNKTTMEERLRIKELTLLIDGLAKELSK